MLHYTQITNVASVDFCCARLWAEYLLIDHKKETDDHSLLNVRQIRGFTNGGLGVFTFWIPPLAEVFMETKSGGRLIFIGQNGDYTNLDACTKFTCESLEFSVTKKDYTQPLDVKDISVDRCPHGLEVDNEILKYYKAPNYCLTGYVTTGHAKNVVANNLRR